MNVYNITKHNFPDAHVHASTLDAFFEKLLAAVPRLNLPVVTGEIGDSWIYGEKRSHATPSGLRIWKFSFVGLRLHPCFCWLGAPHAG